MAMAINFTPPRRHLRLRKRGFTLAELLVSLSVFALLSVAVFQMTMFLARSQSVTTNRLNSVGKAQRITAQLSNTAREAFTFVVYTNYGPWGYDLDNLPTQQERALMQQVHQSAGESGNYFVMVNLHEDLNKVDTMPAPISEVTGIYVDPRSWLSTDGSVIGTPNFLPVRMFTIEFTRDEGIIGNGSLILESHLPDEDDIDEHEVIGYVHRSSVSTHGLFHILNYDAVALNLPIKFRDSDESAALQLETTLIFASD